MIILQPRMEVGNTQYMRATVLGDHAGESWGNLGMEKGLGDIGGSWG